MKLIRFLNTLKEPPLSGHSQGFRSHCHNLIETARTIMIVRRRRDYYESLSPAKLNLTLHVGCKRTDGFHDIQSLMTCINLFDNLRMVADSSPNIRLTVSDRRRAHGKTPLDPVPTDESNLIVRALRLLQTESACTKGATVHLTKRIPSRAGLGGGSSNAATALLLANEAWKIGWSRNRLKEIAAQIGSDVPFFLSDSPCICSGRGEKTTPTEGMQKTHFVLVHPPVGLATLDVFRRYSDTTREKRPFPSLTHTSCTNRLSLLLANDLQPAAEELSPWICRLKTAFDRLNLIGHQMTGSGTAYFGICRSALHARRISGQLQNMNLGVVFLVQSETVIGGSLSARDRSRGLDTEQI